MAPPGLLNQARRRNGGLTDSGGVSAKSTSYSFPTSCAWRTTWRSTWRTAWCSASNGRNGSSIVDAYDDECESVHGGNVYASPQLGRSIPRVGIDQETGSIFTGYVVASCALFHGHLCGHAQSCGRLLGDLPLLLPDLGGRQRKQSVLYDSQLVRTQDGRRKSKLREKHSKTLFIRISSSSIFFRYEGL